MKRALQFIRGLALAGTLMPSVVYLAGGIDLVPSQTWLLVATVVWFLVSLLHHL